MFLINYTLISFDIRINDERNEQAPVEQAAEEQK